MDKLLILFLTLAFSVSLAFTQTPAPVLPAGHTAVSYQDACTPKTQPVPSVKEGARKPGRHQGVIKGNTLHIRKGSKAQATQGGFKTNTLQALAQAWAGIKNLF